MFRNIILFSLFLTSLSGCTGCNHQAESNNSDSGHFKGKIKVGHLVALDMAPLFIAKEAGYFKQEGLDLETVFFSNPGDNNTALVGGSIQFSTNPFTLPYIAANSEINMQIISSAGGAGIMEVIVQGKYKIFSIQEFVSWIKKNKSRKLKIAVLKGDTLEMIIYKILHNNGLSYDDVEIIWFNDLLAMVDAFKTQQVDVLSHIKPYTTDMVVNHGATSIATNSDIWGVGTPNCTVAIMEDFGKKYPKTVKAYLKALNRGYSLIIDNPDSAANLLQNGNYFKVSKEVLLYSFKNQPKTGGLDLNTTGMKQAINDMVELGYIKKSNKEIINLSYLKDALSNP